MVLEDIIIRKIVAKDNDALAVVIRKTLKEFNANKPGTVYFDASTDALYDLFQVPRSIYYVAEYQTRILGGGGIYPTEGLPEDTCELVKMYLIKDARGIGLGRLLIEKNLQFAKEQGYKQVYLETMLELQSALKAYEKLGFEYLQHSLGSSGHFGCDLWMLKKL